MQPRRGQSLGEKHRAEFTGADKTDVDRSLMFGASLKQSMEIDGLFSCNRLVERLIVSDHYG